MTETYWAMQIVTLIKVKEKMSKSTYDELKDYVDSEIDRIQKIISELEEDQPIDDCYKYDVDYDD